VAGCCEYGDEPSGSDATELVFIPQTSAKERGLCVRLLHRSVLFSAVCSVVQGVSAQLVVP
jgi:hypothetical protein